MRTYTNWDSIQTNKFISFVDNFLKQGKSNMSAFKEYSKICNLNVLTLRNLYYKKVKEFGIKKQCYKPFKDEDVANLINNINKLKQQGYSVRGACLKLANGDKSKFLRYQNKYRKEEKVNISKNIITIKPRNKGLTDDDINNLIKGFVGLIKKTAVYDMQEKYKGIINEYNIRLNNTLIELNKKNNLLKEVLTQNEILKGNKINSDISLNKLLSKVKN